MKKIIIIILMMLILKVIFVSAIDPSFFSQVDTTYDLKIPCFESDNSFCTISTICKFTLNSPNGNNLINNQNMTYNTAFYNYTILSTQLNTVGEYSATIQCTGTTSAFQTFILEITEDGNRSFIKQNSDLIILIIVLISSAFLITIGINREDGWTIVLSGFLLMLYGLNVAINGMSSFNNDYTSGFALIIILFGTYIMFRGIEMTGFGENFPRLFGGQK